MFQNHDVLQRIDIFETELYQKSVPVLCMQLVNGSAQDVEGFDMKMEDFCPDTLPTSEEFSSMYQVFIFAAVKILLSFRTTSKASSTAPTFL